VDQHNVPVTISGLLAGPVPALPLATGQWPLRPAPEPAVLPSGNSSPRLPGCTRHDLDDSSLRIRSRSPASLWPAPTVAAKPHRGCASQQNLFQSVFVLPGQPRGTLWMRLGSEGLRPSLHQLLLAPAPRGRWDIQRQGHLRHSLALQEPPASNHAVCFQRFCTTFGSHSAHYAADSLVPFSTRWSILGWLGDLAGPACRWAVESTSVTHSTALGLPRARMV
jgi:hypothetical protein